MTTNEDVSRRGLLVGAATVGMGLLASSALAKVSGVSQASVSHKDGYAVVVPAAGAKDNLPKSLVAAVKESGYEAFVHSGP